MADEYKIVKHNRLDHVEVRCPNCGAVLRGPKVSDMKISQRIACTVCEREWSATIPANNGLEAVASC